MFIALCIASTPLPYKTSQVCLDIFCSYIAFFVSTVVFFIFAGKKAPINKRVVVLLCILLFSRVAFSAIPTFEKGTVKSRFLIWNVTLKMIKENPLMGVGAGNFFVMYPYYGIEKENVLRGTSLVVDKAHNDYLEVCAETGIVGLLLFFYLLFSVFKVSLVLYRGADRKEKLLIAGIVSSLVAISTNALASFPFKNPATLLIFWVDIAFIGALYRRKVGEKPVRVSYRILKLYFLFFVLTGIVLSYMGIKASRYIFLAKNTKDRLSLQYAEMATTYNPYSFKYAHFTGTIAMNIGDYNKAYNLLTKGIKLNPYYDSLHNNLGLVYFLTGKTKEAEASFLRALQLSPDSYEFNNNIGFLYLNTERYDEAIHYLQKATYLKPDAYTSLFSLGVAYYKKGQYKEAKDQFLRVLEIKPDFTPASEYLKKLSD